MSSPVNSSFEDIWKSIAPYAAPPISAAVAIIPSFYGFVVKSAQQVGEPIPRMTVFQVIKGGFKASPTIGLIVGTQLIVQGFAEKFFKKPSIDGKEESNRFSSMVASSIVVGIISAPGLAIFNALTMEMPVSKALKELSIRQVGAITVRETSFLFSIRISHPISEMVKQQFGENDKTKYSVAFMSGAIGSVIGHPADTLLSNWQKGKKVTNLSQIMKGAPAKAAAVGVFSMTYEFVKSNLYKTK